MWDRLLADQIAYVSTDHAPWPLDRKASPDIFANSAGLPGMQTLAPLMFSLLAARGLSHSLMAIYCAERPAKLHGLFPKKGAIRVGSDADLLVLRREEYAFDEATIVDLPATRWSPYHGMRLQARVAATVLRGRLIWDGSRVLSVPGDGHFVRRQHV